ncbi:MAG TPA: 5'/3'-nucleotidase SurE [Bacteroidota bacterium]|nr:5'/3'-nucleotidase SurE [Bacteroidota bacterium]
MARTRPVSILISNDDGIDAPGIEALAREMRRLGTVTVVAPDKQRSAVGHAITMNYPLRSTKFYKQGKFFGYAIEGTPADCIKLAVRSILPSPPDLVLSGVNHGSNTAINVIYSGTVSAATEGTILGIPSIAVSLTTYGPPDFRPAARFARKLAAMVLHNGLPSGTLLNVNVPAVPAHAIRGVRFTRQGKTKWDDTFDVRTDPNNKEYFWLTGKLEVIDHGSDTDEIAIRERCISVTPIQYDLTDYQELTKLRRWNTKQLLPGGTRPTSASRKK